MADNQPTRLPQPIILIRGFGGFGVDDEKRIAYQGFNDGTVYPQKRGENYIYEGLVLRFMKSRWQYRDATNVVGYYSSPIGAREKIPEGLADLDAAGFFSGDKVVIDPAMALALIKGEQDPLQTLWVFRYYDLSDRVFSTYGRALVRLIDFIRALARLKTNTEPKVNIIAHSMGGLIVREAIQGTYKAMKRDAAAYINKVVTLGTPHQGISFQFLQHWIRIDAKGELEHFNHDNQKKQDNETGYLNFAKNFPPPRILTVVGTNYRTYEVGASSVMNRVFSVDEFGPNYNRSDGLVQQSWAQLPGAPRTFVHKCHGGVDSLVTSREAFEISTRFFFGNIRVRLNLVRASVKRGLDMFGKSELFFGVSIKPRGVDFDLFHQSAEAENCYGPFASPELTDKGVAFDWAGEDRLIWEGWLDTTARAISTDRPATANDIVMRLDFYVGERDLLGLGFSDNVIFRKQYYVRAIIADPPDLQLYDNENFVDDKPGKAMTKTGEGWEFPVGSEEAGFTATLRISFDMVPESG